MPQHTRIARQDKIYRFRRRLLHGPWEEITVWRWHTDNRPCGGFGYRSASYIKPAGYYERAGLRNLRAK